VEGFQVLEDQGVAVVHVTGPIRTSLGGPRGGILDGGSGGWGGNERGGGGGGRGWICWRLSGLKGNGVESEILKTHRISRKSGSLWRFWPEFVSCVRAIVVSCHSHAPTNRQNVSYAICPTKCCICVRRCR
jgi:hypothetical protein